ncbi:protein ATP6V1FNB [Megalops cyprinoides]|uniref:protein ATP6V1FNB n=1 Tax=Megalops cyprinoides TaxID=118141 RepID=UPI001864BD62|nr:protein ATP6V1FNB [Megalops cyprinoides]
MRNLLTTQNQNCYRELIEKEAYTRMAWKVKYGKDYPIRYPSRTAKTQGPPKLAAPKTVLPPVVKTVEKKKEAPPVPMERTLSEAPLMRPVTPQTKDVLYQGFSKEGKGRHLYLQRRTQKDPEQKFDYPLLSSWEYGWRLGDYEREYRSPANGRSGIVRNTFYARNGIFHFPSATDRLG